MKACLLALALFAVSAAANATYCPDGSLIASHPNGDCSKSNTPPTSNHSKSSSDANAAAKAGAWSGSKSSAAGGAGGSSNVSAPSSATSTNEGNTNSLGAIGNDNSSSSFRALAVSLPTAVFTPPLPMSDGNCTNVDQDAGAVGWNFASKASAHQSTDHCVLIKLHNSYLAECQYASAKQIKDLLTAKLLPGFKATDNGMVDLATDACRALLAPVPPTPPTVVNVLQALPPSCPAPVVAHRGAVKPRKVVGCK